MGTHAKYSPSRLPRIIACPGSVSACAKVEEEKQSTYAAEGSLLHLATERCFDVLKMDEKCPSDIVSPGLDKEQCRAVNDCLDYAWGLEREIALIDPNAVVAIENRGSLKEFGIEDADGTSDYSILYYDMDLQGYVLHVVDWKFGKGVAVYAEGNDQLYSYAVSRIATPEMLSKIKKIVIHIVQPRISNYDHVELTANDLQRWLDHTLKPALDAALQKNPPFQAGKKQCMWCGAKNTCEHRHVMVNELASDLFAVHARLPNAVDNAEVAKLLANADLITDYLKDMKSYAMNQLKQGKDFPGYKAVAGRSIRGWSDQSEAKAHLTMLLDEDDLYTKKFVSPAQAEKLISRKDSTSDEFKALIVKPEGKPTLALETDRRPALSISAENVFSKLAK